MEDENPFDRKRTRMTLTVAKLVVSILLPGIHSPVLFFWSSLLAATTLRKLKSAQSVSRFGVGSSWTRCWSASCWSRLFRISAGNEGFSFSPRRQLVRQCREGNMYGRTWGWERKMNRTQALTPINTFCAAVSTQDFLLPIIISLYIYLEKNNSGTYKICVRSCFVI